MRDLNGELIGFELDVGRQLAEDMGVEVEFVPTAWDGIIPGPRVGQFRRHHLGHVDHAAAQPDGQLHRSPTPIRA